MSDFTHFRHCKKSTCLLGDNKGKSDVHNTAEFERLVCWTSSLDAVLVSFQKPAASAPPSNVQTNLVTSAQTVTSSTLTQQDTTPDVNQNDASGVPAFTSTPKPQVTGVAC